METEFVDRRDPKNEAKRQEIHAAGLDRRKKYIGPERREKGNQGTRILMDLKAQHLIKNGETPVIDSKERDVYALSAMKRNKTTGDWYPRLGHQDGILID